MNETRDAKGVVIERKKGVYGESETDTAEKGLERSGRHSEVGICCGGSMSFSKSRMQFRYGFSSSGVNLRIRGSSPLLSSISQDVKSTLM